MVALSVVGKTDHGHTMLQGACKTLPGRYHADELAHRESSSP